MKKSINKWCTRGKVINFVIGDGGCSPKKMREVAIYRKCIAIAIIPLFYVLLGSGVNERSFSLERHRPKKVSGGSVDSINPSRDDR